MIMIEALKSRLNNNNILKVQREDGYVASQKFDFYPGASIKELEMLPKYTSKDVLVFLEEYNGAELFVEPEYGGGFQIFSVNEILEYIDVWSCPENFIPIGVGPDGEWIVCESGIGEKDYMWIGEFLSFEDEFERISISYLEWLDYLIVAQGAHFWNWIRK